MNIPIIYYPNGNHALIPADGEKCKDALGSEMFWSEQACAWIGNSGTYWHFDIGTITGSVRYCLGPDPVAVAWKNQIVVSSVGGFPIAGVSFDTSNMGFETPKIEKTCQHSWKKYVGLMDSFDYCEKCDEKRIK